MNISITPLIELKNIVGDSFTNLINDLLAELDKDVKALPEIVGSEVNSDNIKAVALHAHQLKGSLGSLGALDLTREVNKLELAAKDQSIEKCNSIFNSIAEPLSRVVDDVKNACAKLP